MEQPPQPPQLPLGPPPLGPLAGVKRPRGPPASLRLDVTQAPPLLRATSTVTNEADAWWKRMRLTNDSVLAAGGATLTLGAVPVAAAAAATAASAAGTGGGAASAPAPQTPRSRLGALLQSAPVLVETASGLGITCAVARNVLNRSYEDRSRVVVGTSSSAGSSGGSSDETRRQAAYFAVFDGHGGATASQWAADNLHSYIIDALTNSAAASDASADAAPSSCCAVAARLTQAFRDADAELLQRLRAEFAAQAAARDSPARSPSSAASGSLKARGAAATASPSIELSHCQGTTALTALLELQAGGARLLTVASVGDSRAVAVVRRQEKGEDGVVVVPLTRQHSLTREALTPSGARTTSGSGVSAAAASFSAPRSASTSDCNSATASAASSPRTAQHCASHSLSVLNPSSSSMPSFLDGERARIAAAGVTFDRHGFVGGILGLTRSLGNAPFKRGGGSGGGGAEAEGVSAIIPDPDVIQVPLSGCGSGRGGEKGMRGETTTTTTTTTAAEETTGSATAAIAAPAAALPGLTDVAFLVLATDGLWDVLPDAEVGRLLTMTSEVGVEGDASTAGRPASTADLATRLVAEAALRGASDDVTVCVIAVE